MIKTISFDDLLNPKMYSTWIDHNRKLIYCKIPKNAGSTMMNILSMPYANRCFHPVEREDYFTFCIIRNPIDRFFSGFEELSKRKSRVTVNSDYWKYKDPCDQIRSLVDDMEIFMSKSPYYFDPHIRPQTWYLSYDDGSPYIIDKFYNIENLDSAILDLYSRGYLSHLNIPISIPKLNSGICCFRSLFNNDDNIFSRIETIYKKDMILYMENK